METFKQLPKEPEKDFEEGELVKEGKLGVDIRGMEEKVLNPEQLKTLESFRTFFAGGSDKPPEGFADDKDIMMFAVREYWFALVFASEKLKDDKEVVLASVETNGESLQYASKRLRENREVVLTAIQDFGTNLKFADPKFYLNKEIVIEAIKNTREDKQNEILLLLPQKLKDDPDIVEALKNPKKFSFEN